MCILFYRPTVTDDEAIPMTTNILYQHSTSQHFICHQPNPTHNNASDIRIYDEISGNQHEELVADSHSDDDDANQGNASYFNQINQQDDQGHADSLTMDDEDII